jgi:hypothetical protein
MTQKISRRTLLRGAGAAVSLPWLESISAGAPAKGANTLSEPPLRAAFLFMPNGVRPEYWTPPGDAADYEITPHLKPIEDLKSEFLLIENLWNKNTVGRNGHWPKVPAWLSGGYVERTTGGDLDSGGTTVDQVAARRIGLQTPGCSANRHRYGGRWIPSCARFVSILGGSAHSGTEGDRPAACLRSFVPE